jgi:hypothetical protein
MKTYHSMTLILKEKLLKDVVQEQQEKSRIHKGMVSAKIEK